MSYFQKKPIRKNLEAMCKQELYWQLNEEKEKYQRILSWKKKLFDEKNKLESDFQNTDWNNFKHEEFDTGLEKNIKRQEYISELLKNAPEKNIEKDSEQEDNVSEFDSDEDDDIQEVVENVLGIKTQNDEIY